MNIRLTVLTAIIATIGTITAKSLQERLINDENAAKTKIDQLYEQRKKNYIEGISQCINGNMDGLLQMAGGTTEEVEQNNKKFSKALMSYTLLLWTNQCMERQKSYDSKTGRDCLNEAYDRFMSDPEAFSSRELVQAAIEEKNAIEKKYFSPSFFSNLWGE